MLLFEASNMKPTYDVKDTSDLTALVDRSEASSKSLASTTAQWKNDNAATEDCEPAIRPPPGRNGQRRWLPRANDLSLRSM